MRELRFPIPGWMVAVLVVALGPDNLRLSYEICA